MIVGSCIISKTEHICDTVITQAIIADALCGKVCHIGVDHSTGLVFYEFSFVFEGVFERLLIADVLVIVEGTGKGDDWLPKMGLNLCTWRL